MYCTIDDIKSALPMQELLRHLHDTNDYDTGGTLTAEDITRVESIIADVSEIADGYMRERYTVPLTFPSKVVKDLTVTLSLYRIYQLRESGREQMPESLVRERDSAHSRLREIQSGILLLQSGQPAIVRPKFRTKCVKKIFTDDFLADMP